MKKILAVLMATSALALLVGGGVALAATINCPNATGATATVRASATPCTALPMWTGCMASVVPT